jgi:hypothetical protein
MLKTIKVKFLYEESGYCREYFQCTETNKYYIRQEESENNFIWYTTDARDGEPEYPVKNSIVFEIINPNIKPSKSDQFKYMMLSRLKMDIQYYLGWGKRNNDHLYYKDPKKHIQQMKNLWDSFEEDKKPDWLTMEQIKEYERIIFETNELPYY